MTRVIISVAVLGFDLLLGTLGGMKAFIHVYSRVVTGHKCRTYVKIVHHVSMNFQGKSSTDALIIS